GIGPVVLASSTSSLSGKGVVGSITNPSGTGSAATGTVDPGYNGGASPSFGILTAASVIFGPSTTFPVDLGNSNPSPTQPVAGTDYDQLKVTRTANIEGAILGGTTQAGVHTNDSFTILTATSVSGNFFQVLGGTLTRIVDGGAAFIGGRKYTVRYFGDRVV